MKRSSPKIALRGFKPDGRGTGRVLGDLESSVIEILWAEPGSSVVDVEKRLRTARDIAHTTVLTTLDRMHRKGYLTREKHGKAFLYSPAYSREEFERRMAHEVLCALIGNSSAPALSAFVDLVAEDAEALDQLEELVREKKRAARNAGSR